MSDGTALPTILSQIRGIDRRGLSSPSLHSDLESLASDLNHFLGETKDVHNNALALGFAYVQRKSGFRYLWKVVYSEIMFPHSGDVYGLPVLLIKRLATVNTSKVYLRIKLDENTLIFENLDYGDYRVMVMREDVSIELRFESLVCCRRFISGCSQALKFRESNIKFSPPRASSTRTRMGPSSDAKETKETARKYSTPTKPPATSPYTPCPPPTPPDTHDEDLLGLFDSHHDDDDSDDEVTKPFAYHSPKKEAKSPSNTDLSSKPLKEIIRMAKALKVNTDGMLDREELEEAVNAAISIGEATPTKPFPVERGVRKGVQMTDEEFGDSHANGGKGGMRGTTKGTTPTHSDRSTPANTPSNTARPSPNVAQPNLAQQMHNIRLQREQDERLKKQRLWQEKEDERRAEKDRLRKASSEQYQKERDTRKAWEDYQKKQQNEAFERQKKGNLAQAFSQEPFQPPSPHSATRERDPLRHSQGNSQQLRPTVLCVQVPQRPASDISPSHEHPELLSSHNHRQKQQTGSPDRSTPLLRSVPSHPPIGFDESSKDFPLPQARQVLPSPRQASSQLR